jgi:hypothetical protein
MLVPPLFAACLNEGEIVRPRNCVQSLQRYVEAGATTILLRVAGYDQKRQFKRVTEEILPASR